jgi:hypothetical protein
VTSVAFSRAPLEREAGMMPLLRKISRHMENEMIARVEHFANLVVKFFFGMALSDPSLQ